MNTKPENLHEETLAHYIAYGEHEKMAGYIQALYDLLDETPAASLDIPRYKIKQILDYADYITR